MRTRMGVSYAHSNGSQELYRFNEWRTHLSDEKEDVYSIIGEDGFPRLVAAFYCQIPKDDLLGVMYPKSDREGAEQRLRNFLIYRFGGPPRYIEQRGHPRLRARHLPFRIDQAARDRWLQLMDNALTEAALPINAEKQLRGFFEQMSSFMINQPNPEDTSSAQR